MSKSGIPPQNTGGGGERPVSHLFHRTADPATVHYYRTPNENNSMASAHLSCVDTAPLEDLPSPPSPEDLGLVDPSHNSHHSTGNSSGLVTPTSANVPQFTARMRRRHGSNSGGTPMATTINVTPIGTTNRVTGGGGPSKTSQQHSPQQHADLTSLAGNLSSSHSSRHGRRAESLGAQASGRSRFVTRAHRVGSSSTVVQHHHQRRQHRTGTNSPQSSPSATPMLMLSPNTQSSSASSVQSSPVQHSLYRSTDLLATGGRHASSSYSNAAAATAALGHHGHFPHYTPVCVNVLNPNSNATPSPGVESWSPTPTTGSEQYHRLPHSSKPHRRPRGNTVGISTSAQAWHWGTSAATNINSATKNSFARYGGVHSQHRHRHARTGESGANASYSTSHSGTHSRGRTEDRCVKKSREVPTSLLNVGTTTTTMMKATLPNLPKYSGSSTAVRSPPTTIGVPPRLTPTSATSHNDTRHVFPRPHAATAIVAGAGMQRHDTATNSSSGESGNSHLRNPSPPLTHVSEASPQNSGFACGAGGVGEDKNCTDAPGMTKSDDIHRTFTSSSVTNQSSPTTAATPPLVTPTTEFERSLAHQLAGATTRTNSNYCDEDGPSSFVHHSASIEAAGGIYGESQHPVSSAYNAMAVMDPDFASGRMRASSFDTQHSQQQQQEESSKKQRLSAVRELTADPDRPMIFDTPMSPPNPDTATPVPTPPPPSLSSTAQTLIPSQQQQHCCGLPQSHFQTAGHAPVARRTFAANDTAVASTSEEMYYQQQPLLPPPPQVPATADGNLSSGDRLPTADGGDVLYFRSFGSGEESSLYSLNHSNNNSRSDSPRPWAEPVESIDRTYTNAEAPMALYQQRGDDARMQGALLSLGIDTPASGATGTSTALTPAKELGIVVPASTPNANRNAGAILERGDALVGASGRQFSNASLPPLPQGPASSLASTADRTTGTARPVTGSRVLTNDGPDTSGIPGTASTDFPSAADALIDSGRVYACRRSGNTSVATATAAAIAGYSTPGGTNTGNHNASNAYVQQQQQEQPNLLITSVSDVSSTRLRGHTVFRPVTASSVVAAMVADGGSSSGGINSGLMSSQQSPCSGDRVNTLRGTANPTWSLPLGSNVDAFTLSSSPPPPATSPSAPSKGLIQRHQQPVDFADINMSMSRRGTGVSSYSTVFNSSAAGTPNSNNNNLNNAMLHTNGSFNASMLREPCAASVVTQQNRAALVAELKRRRQRLQKQLGQLQREATAHNIFALIRASNASQVQYLLQEKLCCVNDRDYNGCTPLHVAAGEGNQAIVRVLLSFGADALAVDHSGRTPLDCAAANRHSGVGRYLLTVIRNKRLAQDTSSGTDDAATGAAGTGSNSIVDLGLPPSAFPNNSIVASSVSHVGGAYGIGLGVSNNNNSNGSSSRGLRGDGTGRTGTPDLMGGSFVAWPPTPQAYRNPSQQRRQQQQQLSALLSYSPALPLAPTPSDTSTTSLTAYSVPFTATERQAQQQQHGLQQKEERDDNGLQESPLLLQQRNKGAPADRRSTLAHRDSESDSELPPSTAAAAAAGWLNSAENVYNACNVCGRYESNDATAASSLVSPKQTPRLSANSNASSVPTLPHTRQQQPSQASQDALSFPSSYDSQRPSLPLQVVRSATSDVPRTTGGTAATASSQWRRNSMPHGSSPMRPVVLSALHTSASARSRNLIAVESLSGVTVSPCSTANSPRMMTSRSTTLADLHGGSPNMRPMLPPSAASARAMAANNNSNRNTNQLYKNNNTCDTNAPSSVFPIGGSSGSRPASPTAPSSNMAGVDKLPIASSTDTTSTRVAKLSSSTMMTERRTAAATRMSDAECSGSTMPPTPQPRPIVSAPPYLAGGTGIPLSRGAQNHHLLSDDHNRDAAVSHFDKPLGKNDEDGHRQRPPPSTPSASLDVVAQHTPPPLSLLCGPTGESDMEEAHQQHRAHMKGRDNKLDTVSLLSDARFEEQLDEEEIQQVLVERGNLVERRRRSAEADAESQNTNYGNSTTTGESATATGNADAPNSMNFESPTLIGVPRHHEDSLDYHDEGGKRVAQLSFEQNQQQQTFLQTDTSSSASTATPAAAAATGPCMREEQSTTNNKAASSASTGCVAVSAAAQSQSPNTCLLSPRKTIPLDQPEKFVFPEHSSGVNATTTAETRTANTPFTITSAGGEGGEVHYMAVAGGASGTPLGHAFPNDVTSLLSTDVSGACSFRGTGFQTHKSSQRDSLSVYDVGQQSLEEHQQHFRLTATGGSNLLRKMDVAAAAAVIKSPVVSAPLLQPERAAAAAVETAAIETTATSLKNQNNRVVVGTTPFKAVKTAFTTTNVSRHANTTTTTSTTAATTATRESSPVFDLAGALTTSSSVTATPVTVDIEDKNVDSGADNEEGKSTLVHDAAATPSDLQMNTNAIASPEDATAAAATDVAAEGAGATSKKSSAAMNTTAKGASTPTQTKRVQQALLSQRSDRHAAEEQHFLEQALHEPPDLATLHHSSYTTVCDTVSIIVCMVGLPGRGKSFIGKRLVRYMNWKGVPCRVFNAGNYRRQLLGVEGTAGSAFFDPNNSKGAQLREKMVELACEDLVNFIASHTLAIGILDATNTTRKRRAWLSEYFQQEAGRRGVPYRLLFIESVCTDDTIVTENILRSKCDNDDFKNVKDVGAIIAEFRSRILQYEKVYETCEPAEHMPYIKIINVKHHVILHHVPNGLGSRIAFFLLNLHPIAFPIYIALPGETVGDQKHAYGGEERLTARGEAYAIALKNFIQDRYVPHMVVLHATNYSVLSTLAPLMDGQTEDEAGLILQVPASSSNGNSNEAVGVAAHTNSKSVTPAPPQQQQQPTTTATVIAMPRCNTTPPSPTIRTSIPVTSITNTSAANPSQEVVSSPIGNVLPNSATVPVVVASLLLPLRHDDSANSLTPLQGGSLRTLSSHGATSTASPKLITTSLAQPSDNQVTEVANAHSPNSNSDSPDNNSVYGQQQHQHRHNTAFPEKRLHSQRDCSHHRHHFSSCRSHSHSRKCCHPLPNTEAPVSKLHPYSPTTTIEELRAMAGGDLSVVPLPALRAFAYSESTENQSSTATSGDERRKHQYCNSSNHNKDCNTHTNTTNTTISIESRTRHDETAAGVDTLHAVDSPGDGEAKNINNDDRHGAAASEGTVQMEGASYAEHEADEGDNDNDGNDSFPGGESSESEEMCDEVLCPVPGLDNINYGRFSGHTATWVKEKYPRLSTMLYDIPEDEPTTIATTTTRSAGATSPTNAKGGAQTSKADEGIRPTSGAEKKTKARTATATTSDPPFNNSGSPSSALHSNDNGVRNSSSERFAATLPPPVHYTTYEEAVAHLQHASTGADPRLSYCVQFPNGESCRQVNVRLEPALMAVMRTQSPVFVVAPSVPAQGVLAFFMDVIPELSPTLRIPSGCVIEIGVKDGITVHPLLPDALPESMTRSPLTVPPELQDVIMDAAAAVTATTATSKQMQPDPTEAIPVSDSNTARAQCRQQTPEVALKVAKERADDREDSGEAECENRDVLPGVASAAEKPA